ncbi:MAG: DUF4062 domain-containing protein [Planctomycetota bacterium]
MIPNVFVSSTIADLHYLRDGLRDAIEELCYHPVMSEHGEVGYLNPTTAAESCYRSVRQCQIVVLIVGKRYGSTSDDGLSVTHKEFLASKDQHIPTITFVEPHVLSYKEVFHADPNATLWDGFAAMDNPRGTFQLLDAIASSEAFNAIIPINSVGDAKKRLKMQIADFVGNRLSETVLPMSTQLRDVLAEITTVRNLIVHSSDALQSKEDDTKRYHAATRFLLNDNAAEYRKLLEQVFGDLDAAIMHVVNCDGFQSVLSRAGYSHDIVADDAPRDTFMKFEDDPNVSLDQRAIYGSFGARGGYVVYGNKHIKLSNSVFLGFDAVQKALHAKAKLT